VHLKIFMWSYIVTAIALVVAFFYDSWSGVVLCLILGVLEVSLSFDNAVINATVLERMNDFWQRMFLTVGIVIAVFGMRLLLPLIIVWLAAGLPPLQAFELALNPPADGAAYFPDGSPSYETLLTDAHPLIASFGGMFLLMLFLSWLFEEREHTWLTWLERPLAKAGRLDAMAVLVSCVTLLVVSQTLADASRAMQAGRGDREARIAFSTPELLWQVLTAKRWELLKGMCGAGPMSIREAARRVGRDVKAVHSDVTALLEAGVLQRTSNGAVEFPFDAVKVEFMLQAA